MKLTIEPTTHRTELNGKPCSVHEGVTPRGVKVWAYLLAVVAQDPADSAALDDEMAGRPAAPGPAPKKEGDL